MTKHEAAIVSAYTGKLIGEFNELHDFIETILERPVWTDEFASKEFSKLVQEKAKPYFVALVVE